MHLRTMKKILYSILVVAALFLSESVMAQSRTSYHMEGSYFRNELNPALAPTRGYLALPGISGIGLNMGTNWLSVDNLIYERNGELVTALHGSVTADDFLSRIPETTSMNLRENLNVLGVGFYAGKMYWTFGVNQHLNADFTLSKDFFRAIKTLGNGVYDMGNAQLNAMAYLDAYLGTSFRIGKHVNVGIKAKFLMGVAHANASFSKLSLNVGEDKIDGVLHGDWYGNAICFDNRVAEGIAEPTFEDFIPIDPYAMFQNVDSFGAAIDLGTEVRLLNNHLKISAAITDLGFIKWQPQSYLNGEIDGNFYFNGFNLSTGEAETGAEIVTDNLVMPSNPTSYTTRLNFNINAGVEYNFLRNHFAVGLLSHTEFYNSTCLTELTASINIRPTNWITLTGSHTFFNNNRPGIFGAAINIHPSVLNIYVAADFIDPNFVLGPEIEALGGKNLLISRYAKTINLYAGVGFNFARPKFIRQEAKQLKAELKAERKAERQAKNEK